MDLLEYFDLLFFLIGFFLGVLLVFVFARPKPTARPTDTGIPPPWLAVGPINEKAPGTPRGP
jgi:hypothetical protein